MQNSGSPPAQSGDSSAPAPTDDGATARSTVKRELVYGAIAFVTGFVILPVLIYIVGNGLLGPYAGGKGAGTFLGEFYSHLLQGALRTWFIALSPYLAFWILRLIFKRSLFGKSRPQIDSPDPTENGGSVAPTKAPTARREPFIST